MNEPHSGSYTKAVLNVRVRIPLRYEISVVIQALKLSDAISMKQFCFFKAFIVPILTLNLKF